MPRQIGPPWPWPCARAIPPGRPGWRLTRDGWTCSHHCDATAAATPCRDLPAAFAPFAPFARPRLAVAS